MSKAMILGQVVDSIVLFQLWKKTRLTAKSINCFSRLFYKSGALREDSVLQRQGDHGAISGPRQTRSQGTGDRRVVYAAVPIDHYL